MSEPANGVRKLELRVPDPLHEWLTALAARERRSLDDQVIVLLERLREDDERRHTDEGR